MSPAIKLTYFNIKGLGEPIRILLKYGEIEFEDGRLEREEWVAIKPTTPFGQVPTYEENGKTAWQSTAICRYIAKKVKLAGENDWEDLEIDAVVDTIKDLIAKYGAYGRETDPQRKAEMKGPLFNETLPFYLQKFDVIAKENDGHLALKRLTWADIYFFSLIDRFPAGTFSKYPNLEKLIDNVKSIPQVKAWLEIRPQTEH